MSIKSAEVPRCFDFAFANKEECISFFFKFVFWIDDVNKPFPNDLETANFVLTPLFYSIEQKLILLNVFSRAWSTEQSLIVIKNAMCIVVLAIFRDKSVAIFRMNYFQSIEFYSFQYPIGERRLPSNTDQPVESN